MLLNAYPLSLTGRLILWRFPNQTRARRRDMEAEVGVDLWADQGYFWAADEPSGVNASLIEVAAVPADDVRLFAARGALAAHARSAGCEAWTAFGEVNCVGLLPPERVGSFCVAQQLVMRVVQEDYADGVPMLIARRTHRWTWAGTLADAPVQQAAVGGRAMRLSGDGPPRGKVVSADGDELILERDGERVAVTAGEYTVKATSPLVRRVGGAGVLQAMQIASGSLTQRHRRNKRAVRDRFDAAQRLLEVLGTTVPLPGGVGEIAVSHDRARVDLDDS